MPAISAESVAPVAPAAGLIGPGTIGRVHAIALAELGVPLAGVVGSSPASGERAAAQLGTRAFATADELIADPAVGVVHICTPHPLHADAAHAALRAGKHVVCEKPLTVDPDTARELADAAERAGVVHAVCHDQRFAEGIAELRRAVAEGELGELHLVNGAFHVDEVRTLGPEHWMLDPARVGPSLTLADIGVHWWDLVEHITGERVVAGTAALRSVQAGGGLDDSAAVCLRLTGGVHAVASFSQSVGGRAELRLGLHSTTGTAAWEAVATSNDDIASDEKRASFGGMMRAIYDDVAAGRPSPAPAYATFHDGARGVAIMAALLESAASGRWCEVAA